MALEKDNIKNRWERLDYSKNSAEFVIHWKIKFDPYFTVPVKMY